MVVLLVRNGVCVVCQVVSSRCVVYCVSRATLEKVRRNAFIRIIVEDETRFPSTMFHLGNELHAIGLGFGVYTSQV